MALVSLDRGVGAVGWCGPVVVPPLRGDEVERPGLMAMIQADAGVVEMPGLWGAGVWEGQIFT